WMAAWPQAAVRMAHEVGLLDTPGAGRRVTLGGAAAMRQLGDAFNAFADAQQRLHERMQTRVDEARARVDEASNRLAALVSGLPQGAVVCNEDGRIVMCNERAARLLASVDHPEAEPVGPGHSIFTWLDQGQCLHALDKIGRRLEQQ